MGAQPKPRSGVASLAHQDLTSRAAVLLTCAVCSLLRASCLFSRSHPPFTFPLVLGLPAFPFSTGFGQCDSCQRPRFGVGFHSNRPSIDPSVGSPPSLRASPLVPCPFAFQSNLDSVRCVAEQTLMTGKIQPLNGYSNPRALHYPAQCSTN